MTTDIQYVKCTSTVVAIITAKIQINMCAIEFSWSNMIASFSNKFIFLLYFFTVSKALVKKQ